MTRPRASVRYAFGEDNRLVVTERGAAGQLRSRRIVDGTVAVDRANRLVYEFDTLVHLNGGPPVRAVTLDGTWAVTPRHELAFTVRHRERSDRQTIYLRGALVAARDNALVFALRQGAVPEDAGWRRLTLWGRWRADPQNRLNFLVERADRAAERLTLQAGWEVGPHHQLVYRYQQRDGARRRAQEHALTFDGAWEFTAPNRLTYRLRGASDSAVEFRASLQHGRWRAPEGRLAFEVGIGLASGRRVRRRVELFGRWRINRQLTVSFEVPYAQGRVQGIRFEGEVALTARDRLVVALQDSRRRPLGVTVTFTKALWPDARFFVRLRKAVEERSVVGGVQLRF